MERTDSFILPIRNRKYFSSLIFEFVGQKCYREILPVVVSAQPASGMPASRSMELFSKFFQSVSGGDVFNPRNYSS